MSLNVQPLLRYPDSEQATEAQTNLRNNFIDEVHKVEGEIKRLEKLVAVLSSKPASWNAVNDLRDMKGKLREILHFYNA